MLQAEAAIHVEQGNLLNAVRFDRPLRLFRRALLAAAALVRLSAFFGALIQATLPEMGTLPQPLRRTHAGRCLVKRETAEDSASPSLGMTGA